MYIWYHLCFYAAHGKRKGCVFYIGLGCQKVLESFLSGKLHKISHAADCGKWIY